MTKADREGRHAEQRRRAEDLGQLRLRATGPGDDERGRQRPYRNVATARTGSRPTRVSRLPRARRRASTSATAANTERAGGLLERDDDGIHESGLRPERQECVGRAIGSATAPRGRVPGTARRAARSAGTARRRSRPRRGTGACPRGSVSRPDGYARTTYTSSDLRQPGRDPARAVEHAVGGLRQQRRRPQEAAQHQQPAEPAGRRGLPSRARRDPPRSAQRSPARARSPRASEARVRPPRGLRRRRRPTAPARPPPAPARAASAGRRSAGRVRPMRVDRSIGGAHGRASRPRPLHACRASIPRRATWRIGQMALLELASFARRSSTSVGVRTAAREVLESQALPPPQRSSSSACGQGAARPRSGISEAFSSSRPPTTARRSSARRSGTRRRCPRSGRPPGSASRRSTCGGSAGGPASSSESWSSTESFSSTTPRCRSGSLLGQQAGNMAEIIVGALLLRRLIGPRAALDRAEQVGGMLVALGIATAISATVGTLSMLAGGVIDGVATSPTLLADLVARRHLGRTGRPAADARVGPRSRRGMAADPHVGGRL